MVSIKLITVSIDSAIINYIMDKKINFDVSKDTHVD